MKPHKLILLWSSLATLFLLVAAAYQENMTQEWYLLQHEYRDRLPAAEADAFPIQLRQLVIPTFKATDRCVSCHVGMLPGVTPLPGDPVFGPHPDVGHDPAELGCVICHGGQGSATTKADAHGAVPFWPEPMIPRNFAGAGCGTCHTHLAVPNRETLARGRAIFERSDCLACHQLDGRGGTLRPGDTQIQSPDLSRYGMRPKVAGWYDAHLARHQAAAGGAWRNSFGPLAPADRAALEIYLASRTGAPGLVEAKAVFHSQGCRGCHRIGGVGGSDGPDLSNIGNRDPGTLSYQFVPGDPNLANWFVAHFNAPATVVPGSAMPDFRLSEDETRELSHYLFSLRQGELPESWWPRDRLLALRFQAREFTTDGATLYGTFCAACHGPAGEGMRYPGTPAFPALANPEFLTLASDSFIAATIRHGRPGRRMPAWNEAEGGLREPEIQTLVSYIRTLGGGRRPAPGAENGPARWVRGDTAAGAWLFATSCLSCHGADGAGGEGPALANPVFLAAASDTFLIETILRGRSGTAMPAFNRPSTIWRKLARSEAAAIVAYLRSPAVSKP